MVGVGYRTSIPLAVSEGLGLRERVKAWCLRVSRIVERLMARRLLEAPAIVALTMFMSASRDFGLGSCGSARGIA